MFNLKKSPYKVPLSYGFYGALLGTVFYLLLIFSGNSPWSTSSWMGSWIPLVSALLSIKVIQRLNADAHFPFSSVFRIAWITILIQAIIYNIITLGLGFAFGASVIDMYKAEVMENAAQIETMFGDELAAKMIVEMENISLGSLAFTDFIYKIIGGVIVSLILAGIFKEKETINQ